MLGELRVSTLRRYLELCTVIDEESWVRTTEVVVDSPV